MCREPLTILSCALDKSRVGSIGLFSTAFLLPSDEAFWGACQDRSKLLICMTNHLTSCLQTPIQITRVCRGMFAGVCVFVGFMRVFNIPLQKAFFLRAHFISVLNVFENPWEHTPAKDFFETPPNYARIQEL